MLQLLMSGSTSCGISRSGICCKLRQRGSLFGEKVRPKTSKKIMLLGIKTFFMFSVRNFLEGNPDGVFWQNLIPGDQIKCS